VVRLAAAHGRAAPRNETISTLVRSWAGEPMSARALRRALSL
jgi:ketopantoate reductase